MPFLNARFQDVGQCDHLNLRIGSEYWMEHTRSFAMRQISTFERELGWSFWTWKLSDWAEEKNAPSSWYWSFRLASKMGLIDLHNETVLSDICLRPPPDDYITGGNAINGTDDGGMDDISIEEGDKFMPYSSVPPGTAGDEPLGDVDGEFSTKNVIVLGYSSNQTFLIALTSFFLGAIFPTMLYINEKRLRIRVSSHSAYESRPIQSSVTSYSKVSYDEI
jgi:hypothetical protein